ncbi:MAG: hypothetical protein ABTQ28_21000 [Thauera sp.]
MSPIKCRERFTEFSAFEFDGIRMPTGLNDFTPPQMLDRRHRRHRHPLQGGPGRYGRTSAHKDIDCELASWMSAGKT